MTVQLLTRDRFEEYDSLLATSPEALIYHSLRYRDLLLAVLPEAEARYWVVCEDDTIVAALPTMAQDGPFGEVLNSLPWFGSHGDVIGGTTAQRRQLREHWATESKRAAAATLVANPWGDQHMPATGALRDERIGQVTMLESISKHDDLMSLIDSSTRRNVRKAQAEGVRIRTDPRAWDLLEDLHFENMDAIGGNPKPPSFFEAAQRIFRPETDYDLFVADLDGEDVAALLVLYYKNVVEYFVPATRLKFRNLQPMAAILAEAMVASARRGFVRWNWGGTWKTQEGVLRFKRKWGAADVPYSYATTVNEPRILMESPDRLASSYPCFFVIPYAALEKDNLS